MGLLRGLVLACLAVVAVGQGGDTPPITWIVLRTVTTDNEWFTHLGNSNGANDFGVLAYLHTKIIPFPEPSPTCTRKNDYNSIAKYEVIVFNPQKTPFAESGASMSTGYNEYTAGKCTNQSQCDENYKAFGHFVGGTTVTQDFLPGQGYDAQARWYSFPQEGFCGRAGPNGTPNCTWTARFLGMLKLDDLVNSYDPEHKVIDPDFHSFCTSNHTEEKLDQTDKKLCTTVASDTVPFWRDPCNAIACSNRAIRIRDDSLWNYTLPNGCSGKGEPRNTYKFKDECVRTCPSNYFLNWQYECLPCPAELNCETCNWASGPPSQLPPHSGDGGTRCISCAEGLYFNGPNCVTHCDDDQWANKMVCERCDAKCATCTGPGPFACQICNRTSQFPYLDMNNHTCLHSCGEGRYSDNSSVCQTCKPSCATCRDGDGSCLSCTGPKKFMYKGSCLNACPDGFPPDKTNECLKSSSSNLVTETALYFVIAGIALVCCLSGIACFHHKQKFGKVNDEVSPLLSKQAAASDVS
mmetsp:Transcript_3181/g.6009  ORF Transcript_3181/g.6009 Transcript_3181/m.6009 type:complete len:522 (-) Transcript_3181:222-1787(-)|eukprot:CAMPEP_0175144878 /NCGR_PEP_ID=MMETSP0087-20121206/14422_1 /TAXON_ID=136419 /ORGANISM="Unknown Unknown, Strain D1" /LENGTH=521 /DNA_ID=CAMNT_0016429487 /DNA_START=49 /DNA_END=1614 /DNA_ORIENTATION=+